MKLAATFCIAALSLVGCADVETVNGGHLAGMRPAKPSLENPNDSDFPQTPDQFVDGVNQRGMFDLPEGLDRIPGVYAETIDDGYYPLPGNVCGGCQVTLITVPPRDTSTNSDFGEIHVVNDGGNRICKILMNQDGSLDTRDCSK